MCVHTQVHNPLDNLLGESTMFWFGFLFFFFSVLEQSYCIGLANLELAM